MTKIDAPAGRALNPAEQELANVWTAEFVAGDFKTALCYLENTIMVVKAQSELPAEVFKEAYEAAGWGYHKVTSYLRVGRKALLHTEAFRRVLPQIKSFWILNFLASLDEDRIQDFITEYTSNPRPIDRKELFAFAGRRPATSDTLLDYGIDHEKICNLTPELKKRILAKVEEMKRLADDHELPAKLKAHKKVIDLLKPDQAELAKHQEAESQAPDAVRAERAKNDDAETESSSDDAADDDDGADQAELVGDTEAKPPWENKEFSHFIEGELANNDATQSQTVSNDSGSDEDDPDVDAAEDPDQSTASNEKGSDR